MPAPSSLLTMAAAIGSAAAGFQGFNYGADGETQGSFEAKFKAAQGLPGTNGNLLFGLWASAGQESFNNELAALKKTIDQYCDQLDGLVAGISVGSEDIYRDSPIGRENDENPGADPQTLVNYINEVRKAVKGSCLEKAPIGHVDTWTSYVNSTADPLIEACDWLGMDTYPYFEFQKPNPIEQGKALYDAALNKVKNAGKGKPVWITETGWPVSGKKSGQAVASPQNAKDYYQKVGCPMFGKDNVWWYTLSDAGANPSFGLMGADGKPTFDLNCKGHENPPPVSSSKAPETSSAKPETSSSAPPPPPSSSSKQGGGDVTTTIGGGEQSTPASEPTTQISTPTTPESTQQQGGGQETQSSAPSGTAPPQSNAGRVDSMAAAAVAMIIAAVAL
ncbi:hypothetical protein Golomagni_05731 [Golovinomyces magnicellulatus]|nr:hypothetical protein Golomagni_05731 [Golovinomyces magnicellulatus]